MEQNAVDPLVEASKPAVERNHHVFMEEAIKEAVKALEEEEIPVGCVIVNESDEIIGRGHNLTNKSRNVRDILYFI
jgi:tRNA(Arg) A34 adenosine deaminase TadA